MTILSCALTNGVTNNGITINLNISIIVLMIARLIGNVLGGCWDVGCRGPSYLRPYSVAVDVAGQSALGDAIHGGTA